MVDKSDQADQTDLTEKMVKILSPFFCATRLAIVADAASILSCTNDAYVADTFFKKVEYHNRFTMKDVIDMIAAPESTFLVATTAIGEAETVCGSLYLTWKSTPTDYSEKTEIIGKFSAVAVRNEFQQRGIGNLLVRAAEDHIISLAKRSDDTIKEAEEKQPSGTKIRAVITMGVINLREDLFPWYAKQGFKVVGEVGHDPEVLRIVKEGYEHVCLIQMEKVLIPSCHLDPCDSTITAPFKHPI